MSCLNLGILVPVGLTAILACGSRKGNEAEQVVPTVVIRAHDFGFEMPAEIPAGVSRIQMVNDGPELHQVQLFLLGEGHSAAQLSQAIQNGTLPDWAIPVGGPNAAEPGDSAATIQALEPGHFVALCLIPSADHLPHFMKGMMKEFEAVGGETTSTVTPPVPDLYLQLADFSFGLSGPISAGSHLIGTENMGAQQHEVVIARLIEGKSLADFMAWAGAERGAPPVRFVSGVAGIAPGRQAMIEVSLEPGDYLLLCFLSDANGGKPHFMQGMALEFTVDQS